MTKRLIFRANPVKRKMSRAQRVAAFADLAQGLGGTIARTPCAVDLTPTPRPYDFREGFPASLSGQGGTLEPVTVPKRFRAKRLKDKRK